MNGAAPGHEAISASAGSGKTFQLAHRYLRLLALGARPEQLVALTFSRKAAGEIFDSIVGHLCTAATSDDEARILAGRISTPGLSQSDCIALLRGLLDSLHRLRVGTIDSFTAGILRSFPLELGIPPAFELTDSEGAAATAMRQRILDEMSRQGKEERRAQGDFAAAFEQANLGRLGKQVEESLAGFISRYQSSIRALPEAAAWGGETAIWPHGSPWLESQVDVHGAASDVRRLLPCLELPADAARRWRVFVDAVEHYSAHTRWTRDISYLFEKLAPCIGELRAGSATVKLNRTSCDLAGDLARGVLALVTHIVRTDITSALTRTQGIYGTLSAYERRYDEAMRRDGTLSFSDAQFLLTRANSFSGGALLSNLGSGPSRLYIDYRLDARLDHWLLDEFQDTSDLQWEALRNLVEEVLQDDSGRRTLFYVGDVKQAIYGWRGGNPHLFEMLLDTYGGVIEQRTLEASHRSCQAVIDTVNRVFGRFSASTLPARATALWQRFWQHHECAPGVPDKGCAAVLEPSQDDESASGPSSEERYRVVARLLQDIEPLQRGLSTAVLVRSNEQGRALVDYLRARCPDSIIIHEGRAAIKDNPLVAVLLSLVAFAAHPGNTLAWRHLQMSPLQPAIDSLGLGVDSLGPYVLREVQTRGFQPALRLWAERLDRVERLDAFGRIRLEQLLAAAGEFDAGGDTGCDAFLDHIEQYELHETAADDAIRVMTVHQAKGLGFDVVILPELDKHSMERARDADFILSRQPDTQTARWALEMPRRLVAECDDTLRGELEEADARDSFESLCLLYVAMTRAKRGLYIVTSPSGRTSKVYNQSTLVRQKLADAEARETGGETPAHGDDTYSCLYMRGDERWFNAIPRKPGAPPAAARAPREAHLAARTSSRPGLVAVRPSDADILDASAAALFDPDRQLRLSVGAAVHDLLQRITWADDTDIDATAEEWRARSRLEPEVVSTAVEHFRRAMASQRIRAALAGPGGNTALWRERRFDVVIGDRWISGSFDRVVIERDSEDRPVRATIYDFKTDDVDTREVAARARLYEQQLVLYRAALGHILGLSHDRIALRLVFTLARAMVDVD